MKLFLGFLLLLLMWVFLSQCIIMKNRISDAKGKNKRKVCQGR